jgi:hypothetical protein
VTVELTGGQRARLEEGAQQMHDVDGKRGPRGRTRRWIARAAFPLVAIAILALTATSGAHASTGAGKSARHAQKPLKAVVITPDQGESTSSGFNVSLSLQARNAAGNRLLSGYQTQFLDPTGPDGMGNPAFHPGASASAPGLVVTLSSTPNMPGTPLAGPRTNLAGVFQINSVSRVHGLRQTWNDWQVASPGFFGRNRSATLTVYAVRGEAPDVVPAGGLTPISNVVRYRFHIGA